MFLFWSLCFIRFYFNTWSLGHMLYLMRKFQKNKNKKGKSSNEHISKYQGLFETS